MTTSTPDIARRLPMTFLYIAIGTLLLFRALVAIPALANHRNVTLLNAALALPVLGLRAVVRRGKLRTDRIRFVASVVVVLCIGLEGPLFHPSFVRVDTWYALLLASGVVTVIAAVSLLMHIPKYPFVVAVAIASAANTALCYAAMHSSLIFDKLVPSIFTVVVLLLIRLFSELYRAQDEALEAQQRLAEVNARLAAASAEILDGKHRESLSLIGSGIAHEINNPITYLRGSLELLQEQIQEMLGRFKVDAQTRSQTLDLISSMETGIDSILDVVNHIRAIFKESDAPPQRVRVHDALKTVIVSLPRGALDTVRIRNEIDASIEVTAHPGDLYIVATNLLRNAVDATADRDDALITIRTRVCPGEVVLEIEDNGHGMSTAELEACFDPFFTTRSNSGGMGVGLALSRTIAERAGGSITIQSSRGVGTIAQFHIRSAS